MLSKNVRKWPLGEVRWAILLEQLDGSSRVWRMYTTILAAADALATQCTRIGDRYTYHNHESGRSMRAWVGRVVLTNAADVD